MSDWMTRRKRELLDMSLDRLLRLIPDSPGNQESREAVVLEILAIEEMRRYPRLVISKVTGAPELPWKVYRHDYYHGRVLRPFCMFQSRTFEDCRVLVAEKLNSRNRPIRPGPYRLATVKSSAA